MISSLIYIINAQKSAIASKHIIIWILRSTCNWSIAVQLQNEAHIIWISRGNLSTYVKRNIMARMTVARRLELIFYSLPGWFYCLFHIENAQKLQQQVLTKQGQSEFCNQCATIALIIALKIHTPVECNQVP